MRAKDRYCSECGQRKTDLKDRSIWHLLLESVGDFFHFDSKFFRTLAPLLFRPGFLTAEFLKGKRNSYFHPFKMFLFISLLYFITAGLMKREGVGEIERLQSGDSLQTAEGSTNINFTLGTSNQALMEMSTDSLKMLTAAYGLHRLVDLYHPREPWLVRLFIKQIVKNRIIGMENLLETLSHTVSRLIFFLIPVFALLLKLLYIRRRIPYYNHVIFSLHLISFFFILLWIDEFASLLTSWGFAAVIILFMAYLFLALRNSYQQGTGRTLLKWFLFLGASLVILSGFFIAALSISLFLS